jgi:polyphosphate kinase
VIEALYRASQAGVPIDIVARGICCLRPGVPGLSETIRVTSIVDRFLEHSRIYIFGEGEEAEVFLASADWMPRNFFRRVEVMFPVLAADLRARILDEIVPTYLADNTRARRLDAEGVFHLPHPGPGEEAHRCQVEFLQQVAQQRQASVALPSINGVAQPVRGRGRRPATAGPSRAAKGRRK